MKISTPQNLENPKKWIHSINTQGCIHWDHGHHARKRRAWLGRLLFPFKSHQVITLLACRIGPTIFILSPDGWELLFAGFFPVWFIFISPPVPSTMPPSKRASNGWVNEWNELVGSSKHQFLIWLYPEIRAFRGLALGGCHKPRTCLFFFCEGSKTFPPTFPSGGKTRW